MVRGLLRVGFDGELCGTAVDIIGGIGFRHVAVCCSLRLQRFGIDGESLIGIHALQFFGQSKLQEILCDLHVFTPAVDSNDHLRIKCIFHGYHIGIQQFCHSIGCHCLIKAVSLLKYQFHIRSQIPDIRCTAFFSGRQDTTVIRNLLQIFQPGTKGITIHLTVL